VYWRSDDQRRLTGDKWQLWVISRFVAT